MLEFLAEKLLQSTALILSVINGFILLRVHFRDKPKLSALPVYPDIYQWWFRLPDQTYEGHPARVFGFLTYVKVLNRGYRPVQADHWSLRIKSQNRQTNDLPPITLPEPLLPMGESAKIFPVLGQKSHFYPGNTLIEPGCGITGFTFFVYICYGADFWNPQAEKDTIKGTLTVEDVFGGKINCLIHFRETPITTVKKLIPDLEQIPYPGNTPKSQPDKPTE